MSVPGVWTCCEPNCGVENEGPTLYDIMYGHYLRCTGCGARVTPDLQDLIPYVGDLIERVEALEARVWPDRALFKGVGI